MHYNTSLNIFHWRWLLQRFTQSFTDDDYYNASLNIFHWRWLLQRFTQCPSLMVAICQLSLSLLTATWTSHHQLPFHHNPQQKYSQAKDLLEFTMSTESSCGVGGVHQSLGVTANIACNIPLDSQYGQPQQSTVQSVWLTTATVHRMVSMAVQQPQRSTGCSVRPTTTVHRMVSMVNHNSPLDVSMAV